MSRLLAIDCSTKFLSVALFADQVLVQEEIVPPGDTTHSEKLLPFIDSVLTKNQLSLSQIDEWAISTGPGAFTSLRIGVATLKGLLVDQKTPVFSISTLKALAIGVEGYRIIIPILNAGRGRVYGAVYERENNDLRVLLEEGVYESDFLLNKINSEYPSAHILGGGCKQLNLDTSHSFDDQAFPRALSVGYLAFLENKKPVIISNLSIEYSQEPDLGK